jgi:hypothetical protein
MLFTLAFSVQYVHSWSIQAQFTYGGVHIMSHICSYSIFQIKQYSFKFNLLKPSGNFRYHQV